MGLQSCVQQFPHCVSVDGGVIDRYHGSIHKLITQLLWHPFYGGGLEVTYNCYDAHRSSCCCYVAVDSGACSVKCQPPTSHFEYLRRQCCRRVGVAGLTVSVSVIQARRRGTVTHWILGPQLPQLSTHVFLVTHLSGNLWATSACHYNGRVNGQRCQLSILTPVWL